MTPSPLCSRACTFGAPDEEFANVFAFTGFPAVGSAGASIAEKITLKGRDVSRAGGTHLATPLEARKGNGRKVASSRPSGPCRRWIVRGADGA
jgi:hypothetical protein